MMKTYFRLFIVLVVLQLMVACGERDSSIQPSGTILPHATSTASSTYIIQPSPEPTRTQIHTMIPIAATLNEKMPEELPAELSSDLIWIQNGALLRWDTRKNEITNWVGMGFESLIKTNSRVINYQFSNEKDLIVVLENGEIGVINETNNELHTKVSVNYRLEYPSYSVSPDGQWLAFANVEEGDQHMALYEYYLLNLKTNPSRPELLGSCVLHPWTFGDWCETNFVWSNDSSTLAWDGHEGLWTVKPGDDPIFVTHHQTHPDKGFYYSFVPEEWSPNGRYLYSFRTGWDGYLVYLIDTDTGRTQRIPGAEAGLGVESNFQLTWLDNGQLLMIWNPYYDWAKHKVTIYQTSPYSENVLLQSKQSTLPLILSTLESDSEIVVSTKLTDNKIIILTDTDSIFNFEGINLFIRELSLSNLVLSEPTLLFDWEEKGYTENVYWTNDGQWALWENHSNSLAMLISIPTKKVIPLEISFMKNSCCFTWLEHAE